MIDRLKFIVVARPWQRVALASGVALVAAWLSSTAPKAIHDAPRSDFAQIQAAAEASA